MQELGAIMAALAVLAAITATFFLLLGGMIAVSWTINRVDKRGSLRDVAPTMFGQGVLALTGAHAARWDGSAVARRFPPRSRHRGGDVITGNDARA